MTSSFTSLTAWTLSRVAFLTTHVAFVYWLLFVTNDPLNFGLTNTLDAKEVVAAGECTELDWNAVQHNTWTFLVFWWFPHSFLARKAVKKALGTWQTALDRPIFAFIAPIAWIVSMEAWIPVNNCAKFDIFSVEPLQAILAGTVFTLASIEVLGLFYLLPSHVFGTDTWAWKDGKAPQHHGLILSFPYGLVRHPAAAAFIWMYWVAIPSYTVNHLLLASLWTVFIVVGTLVFEEGGLRGQEFPTIYDKYAEKVNAFYPSWWSIRRALGILPAEEDIDTETKSN